MTSDNVKLMPTFVEVSWRRASDKNGVVEFMIYAYRMYTEQLLTFMIMHSDLGTTKYS